MVKMTDTEITKMRIKRIEKEIRDTPLHKGTEHHIGRLRAKLSRLKEKDLDKASKKGGGGGGYAVKKQGDATVVLVGPPSAGKSTLLNKLTNAKSKVAPYAFTTLTVVPGMMEYRDARIQILDVPGLIEGAEEGKGRGREVLSVVRGADLLLVMTDVERTKAIDSITKALERNGIRLNKTAPKAVISKKVSGGIQVVSNFKLSISRETVKSVAKEFGFPNAEITIKEKLPIDRLIDAFSKNRCYIPTIFAVNKSDTSNKPPKNNKYLSTSAVKGSGLGKLKKEIWKSLNFVRVYLVREKEKPSTKNPLIVREGNTLFDVGQKIGEEFMEGKIKAKIWGTGAKYDGQTVSLTKTVVNGMQIRFV